MTRLFRLVAVAVVAASLVGGCRRDRVVPVPPDDQWAVDVGAAGCDAVLPVAGATRLPVLHRRDEPYSDTFVTTAAAFPGDARVGRAAWWIDPQLTGTIRFAGPDRLVVAGEPAGAGTWAVGGVSVRNPAQRWARASRAEVPGYGAAVQVPEGAAGTMVVTAVPQPVRPGVGARTIAVVCGIDAADGHVRWGTEVRFPIAGSEAGVTLRALGGAVVASVGDTTGLVGLAADTGRMRWHTTMDVPATVTVAGGHLVVSPGDDTGEPRGPAEIRALDPGDGHVAWRHSMPAVSGLRQGLTVVATGPGQPVVVRESTEAGGGTTNAATVQLAGYNADGSVRWKQASTSTGRLDALDGLLLEGAESPSYRITARRISDGAIVWRAKLDPSLGDLAASGSRLFLGTEDFRSIAVVDRDRGTVATSLAGSW